jgi:hypothetical protein
VTAFEAQLLDVSADRFGDPQPVQREQRDQSMVAGAGETGSDEHRADLVAVEAGCVGLVVQAGPTDMNGW